MSTSATPLSTCSFRMSGAGKGRTRGTGEGGKGDQGRRGSQASAARQEVRTIVCPLVWCVDSWLRHCLHGPPQSRRAAAHSAASCKLLSSVEQHPGAYAGLRHSLANTSATRSLSSHVSTRSMSAGSGLPVQVYTAAWSTVSNAMWQDCRQMGGGERGGEKKQCRGRSRHAECGTCNSR
jgi:hypothetical protein